MGDDVTPLLVAVDQGVDLKALRQLQAEGRVALVQAHEREQQFKGVDKQGGPFRFDKSRWDGPDRIAGDNVHVVERIIGKHKHDDVDHVYAAWLNDRDYFVTSDVSDFIDGGRREALQAAMPGLRIRTADELIDELGG